MNTLHYVNKLPDGAITTTLCGIRIRTDHKATARAKRSAWTSCPLCELRRSLIDMGLETDPYRPEPSNHWTQPTFAGMEA